MRQPFACFASKKVRASGSLLLASQAKRSAHPTAFCLLRKQKGPRIRQPFACFASKKARARTVGGPFGPAAWPQADRGGSVTGIAAEAANGGQLRGQYRQLALRLGDVEVALGVGERDFGGLLGF